MLIIIILIGVTLIAIPYIVEYRSNLYGVHQRVEISNFMEGYVNLLTHVKHKGRFIKTWCDTVLSEDADIFAEERCKQGKEYYKEYVGNQNQYNQPNN